MRRLLCGAIVLATAFLAGGSPAIGDGPAIVVGEKPSAKATLAARETRRYVYQRTGELSPIVDRLPDRGDAIVFAVDATLGAQQYRMKTTKDNDRAVLRITGGSDLGAAVRGVRSGREARRAFLHARRRHPRRAGRLRDARGGRNRHAPLFETRGIQPFHDFPEGPDWWNLDDYKAILGQLPKMRMNFFGLHTYPEGGVGPGADGVDRPAGGRRAGRPREGELSLAALRDAQPAVARPGRGRLGLRADEDRRLRLRRRRDVRPGRLRARTTCAACAPWPT